MTDFAIAPINFVFHFEYGFRMVGQNTVVERIQHTLQYNTTAHKSNWYNSSFVQLYSYYSLFHFQTTHEQYAATL
jgi:hypothetical protein